MGPICLELIKAADDFLLDDTRIGGDDHLRAWFITYRDQWRSALSEGHEQPPPLWYFVDHGWYHAQMLYIALPHWVRVLEHNLGDELLANPGEWFTLACAAHLHDAGMRCPETLIEEFRKCVLAKNEAARGLVSQRACNVVDAAGDRKLYDSEIRELHADIGAWWTARPEGQRLIPNERVAQAAAAVIRLHGKEASADRSRAVGAILEGGPDQAHTVRVGLLACLIALADACLVGLRWVYSLDHTVRGQGLRDALLADDGTGDPADNNRRTLLAQQEPHFLKHRSVSRCIVLPDRVLIEPADMSQDWWDSEVTLGREYYVRNTLVEAAREDISKELAGARDTIHAALGRDVLPKAVYIIRTDEEVAQAEAELDELNKPLGDDQVVRASRSYATPDPNDGIWGRWAKDSCDAMSLIPRLVKRKDLSLSWRDKAFEVVCLKQDAVVEVSEGPPRLLLKVQLRGDEYGIYNNAGKRFIEGLFLAGDQKRREALQLAHNIHALLLGSPTGRNDKLTVNARTWPLRWASGGFLALPFYRGRRWCALFFREIEPTGWNVANGASECESEYTDLNTLTCREFGEELMVLDGCPDQAIETGARRVRQRLPRCRAAADVGKKMWCEFSSRHRGFRLEHDRIEVETSPEPLMYEAIPTVDSEVVVETLGSQRPCPGVVFSVNPTELGIEVIWPVTFTMGDDDHLLDGEILETNLTLVRRPVILLDLEFLRERLSTDRTSTVAAPSQERPHLDCKLLPEVPGDRYVLFHADIDLRRRIVQRAHDEPAWAKSKKEVVQQAEDWLNKYGDVFSPLYLNKPIESSALRMLCPVTWKTLEVLFAHGWLDGI